MALDLAAETFARVLEHAESYDPSRGAAMAWTFGIARNLLYDALRSSAVADDARRRLGMAEIRISEDDIDRIADLVAVGEQRARRALETLGDDQREAVWARVVLEQDYDALASTFECSESVVRQRVSRGLRSLRASLQEETE